MVQISKRLFLEVRSPSNKTCQIFCLCTSGGVCLAHENTTAMNLYINVHFIVLNFHEKWSVLLVNKPHNRGVEGELTRKQKYPRSPQVHYITSAND